MEDAGKAETHEGGASVRASLFEQLTTGVLLLDGALRVRDLNSAAESLLAVSAKQVVGQPLVKLLPSAERLTATVRRSADTAQPLAERDLPLPRSGASEITVDCVVTPLVDGAEPGSILVELLRLDRHKQISREEQQAIQNESARTLARGLAHEIRNPLGGLRGAAQLLQRELGDPELEEYTRVIVHEADRLQALVDRMLGPRSTLRVRSVNVHEVVERVYALIHAEAPDGCSIERDYDPSLPDFFADPELLIQAILNVARNAVQALVSGGRVRLCTRIERQLTIATKLHRLVIRVDIKDDGAGVPEGLLEQIFFPLVTGRAEGTGLGLSVAQSVVRQHGGLIECTSKPGDTTFSILLPAYQEPARS